MCFVHLINHPLALRRNLADLFSADPDCSVKPDAAAAKPSRAMAFAGSKLDDELDMKKLQVSTLRTCA